MSAVTEIVNIKKRTSSTATVTPTTSPPSTPDLSGSPTTSSQRCHYERKSLRVNTPDVFISDRESRNEFDVSVLLTSIRGSVKPTPNASTSIHRPGEMFSFVAKNICIDTVSENVGAKRTRPKRVARGSIDMDETTSKSQRVNQQPSNIKYCHSREENAVCDSTSLEVCCLKNSSHLWLQKLSDSSPFASLLSAVAMVTYCNDHASHACAQLKQSFMSLNSASEAYSDASISDRSIRNDYNSELHPIQYPIQTRFNPLDCNKDLSFSGRGDFFGGTQPNMSYSAIYGIEPSRVDHFQQSSEALQPTKSVRSPLPTIEKHAKMTCPVPLVHHRCSPMHSVSQPSDKKASCLLTKPGTASAVVAVQVDAKRPPENPFFLKQPRRRPRTVRREHNVMPTERHKPLRVVTVSSGRSSIKVPVQWSVSCQTPRAWLPKPTSAT
jgi:hypothetical protein